jgi:hypothetical protein
MGPASAPGGSARDGAIYVGENPSGTYVDVGPFHDVRMLDDNRFVLKSPLVALHPSGAHNVLYSIPKGARQLPPQEGMDLAAKSLYPSHRSYWCPGADRRVSFNLRQGGARPYGLHQDPRQIELTRGGAEESVTIDIEALRSALRR